MYAAIRRFIKSLLYPLYEWRIVRDLDFSKTPHHVGVILDGNRRWAKANPNQGDPNGHKAGASKIIEFLGWCDDADVRVVTLWLLSTDNFNRSAAEIEELNSLKPIRNDGVEVNVAISYGGRREIVDAVKSYLSDAEKSGHSLDQAKANLSTEDISKFLYTAGQPDPELLIRTSGEQRLGGFMLWQSASSEFYFCEAYWPDFRRVDFLRALRAYSLRQRRFGS